MAEAVIQLKEILHHLHDLIFKDDADFYDLLTIACACAVVWAAFFSIATPLLRNVTYGKSWLRDGCERELLRIGGIKKLNEYLGTDKTHEEAIEEMMTGWAYDKVMITQHFVGGALCVPSMLGLGDPSWASSLAVLGILSEVGWEIEHTIIDLFYARLRYGAEKVPTPMIIGSLIHHSLSCCLGIPVALRYRQWWVIHSLCFDLQIGPGLVTPLAEYGKLLDITKPNGLRQLKIINIIKVIVFGWTRGIHFVYLVALALHGFYVDRAWSFVIGGTPVLLAFTVFNIYTIILPTMKTYLKFRNASAEYDALPKNASEKQRAMSWANVEDVARELIEETENIDPTDRLTMLIDSMQERKGKIERRKTMPPRQMLMSMRSMRLARGKSVPPRAWKMD